MKLSILIKALLIAGVVLTAFQRDTEACGKKPFGSRIVGGEEAKPNSWPWQASLQYYGRHICGASLLNENWVLSAAHCVDQSSDPNRFSVALGAHSRTGDGQVFKVSRVIKHPSFSMQHLRHDVAVLKLATRVSLNSKIQTVCLPKHGSRVSLGTQCYVTGWGRINSYTNTLAPRLKQAKAPVASHNTCRSKNGGTVDESSMVCVGGQGSSVCNGDSGGPLSCFEGGRWFVRGAASWVTSRTCPGNTFSVYARVSSYVRWIESHVGSNGGGGGEGGGGSNGDCVDTRRKCPIWADKGFCKNKVKKMKKFCKKSCNFCDGEEGGGGGGGGGGESRKCGFKPGARIVGGNEAPKGAWPWQAQVRTPSGFTFCGGTLVHPQWVVTAAHCTSKKSASSIRVRVGAHYRSANTGDEQDFQVERIINHESYKRPRGMAHDISLLKLRQPAQLNRKVGLACLPGSSGQVSEGKTCWVTGYGTLSSGGSLAKVLMQVDVPIVSQSGCKRAYGSSIHDSMVCAGLDRGGKDSCQGDSGGPLVCEDGGKFYLEGVVSWGSGCASPGKYGVYARVRYLRQWIDKQMNTY